MSTIEKAIKELSEGVRKSGDKFVFDYNTDEYTDLIYLTRPDFYQDKIFNNVYWFGYAFTEAANRKERAQFLNYIKGLNIAQPTEKELTRFINKPLIKLHEKENITSFDLIVYPKSERSTLVNKIVRCINDVASRDAEKPFIEMIKNLPKNISFDWNSFTKENPRSKQQEIFINDILMPNIQSLDYFSLAQNVKPKYRKYIQNFLTFNSKEDEELFRALSTTNKVLIVDDVNTSGSTLNEILRILNRVNSNCIIYIFTLIGKQ